MDKQSREKGSVMSLLSNAHREEVDTNKQYFNKVEVRAFL